MFKSLTLNKIISGGFVLGLAFIALITLFPNGNAHEILNGIFVGMAVLIALLYRNITIDTILGRGEYRRAQRMALALAIMWAAVNLRTAQSIAYRSMNEPAWLLNMPTGALITYLFIISGYLQITAPGFNDNTKFMHGVSLHRVATASMLAVVVAGLLIWLQRNSMLQGL